MALHEVATEAVWCCHEWDSCPMQAAFGMSGLEGIPLLLRPYAEQFIQFFDAELIPMPVMEEEPDDHLHG